MTLDDLTDRQRALARLAARGYTAREAAHVLGATEADILVELDALYAALGIERHADLVELVRSSPESLPSGFSHFDWASISRSRTG